MAANASKVLIFKAPCICWDFERKRPGDIHKVRRKQPIKRAWKESRLYFDGEKFVSSNSGRETSEDSAESDVRLDYNVDNLQESLVFYLDSEFLGHTRRSMDTCNSTPMFNPTIQQDLVRDLELQKQYEAISEASQYLLLESQAPNCDLLESSKDSIGGDDRETDPATHPCSADDVYARRCGSQRSLQNSSRTVGLEGISAVTRRSPTLPSIHEHLSNLSKCTEKGLLVNIAFVVLRVNAIREIQVRTGQSAGQFVPLSSLLVADESKSHFKLTLWRDASSWTEKISPGDFMVATSVQITSWRGENVGQTTYKSCFYNLHRPKDPLSPEWSSLISQGRLDQLICWTKKNHPYLLKSAHTKKEVVFRRIGELKDNTLVHFQGLLTTFDVATGEGSYTFKNEQLPKIILGFCEAPGLLIHLCLWGQQASWVKDFQAGLKQVWEVTYLTAKYDTDTSSFVLHTTPKSHKKQLGEADPRASEILSRFVGHHNGQPLKFNTIRELYKANYSGTAELDAQVSSLTFNCGEDFLTLTGDFDPAKLTSVAHKLVYVGCRTCLRPLAQDKNSIYVRCVSCVASDPQYKAAVTYCYKPFTISLTHGKEVIEGVEVKHKEAFNLFRDFPARNLAFQKQKELEFFVETVQDLLRSGKRFVLVCQTVVDENSFVEHRYFSLWTMPA